MKLKAIVGSRDMEALDTYLEIFPTKVIMDELVNLSAKTTLMDQFIMAALTGLCSSMRDDRIKTIYDGIQGGKIEAVVAVRIADQVMEARKQK